MEHFFITTPIYYVNDLPHLGHAYTTVLADTFARFYRRLGIKTWFVTGTDEHGQKIERAAEAQGLKPIELADRVVGRFQELWELLGITYNDFIRTTEPRHRAVVEHLWQRMAQRGDIYLGTYSGYYCISCEAYYNFKEVSSNLCPVCGKAVTHREEPSYFFRLSLYEKDLLDFYDRNAEFVFPPERLNEVASFVRGGLEDLSISRRHLRWGIPVPGDPDHVIYVWVDALANYLTVVDPLHPERGLWEFWPPTMHLIGKDILRFHSVYWPAFLLSAGYPLPQRVVAHGWWLVEGKKMSKSLGNVVDPRELTLRYGRDAVRYFLLREVPLGEDGDFRSSQFSARYSGDLANDLGNLIQRIHGILQRFAGGQVKALRDPDHPAILRFSSTFARVKERMLALRPHQALEELWRYIGELNQLVDRTQPWRLSREKRGEELNGVLRELSYSGASLGFLLDPFLPDTARKIRETFGALLPEGWDFALIERSGWQIPLSGELHPLSPLFPREESGKTTSPPPVPPPSTEGKQEGITIEEFARVELKVGRVLECQAVPGSEKLLELLVDLGEGKPRRILAGIARFYRPEELQGRSVLVVANLLPRKMMGRVSEGMILAGEADGVLRIIEPPPELPPGTRLK
jgi:methionyl-tRNA synthetase